MKELRVIFSESHVGSMHSLRRMLEEDWPIIAVTSSDTGRVEFPRHKCGEPVCTQESVEYWDTDKDYVGAHRNVSRP